jgi:hypothetical protein
MLFGMDEFQPIFGWLSFIGGSECGLLFGCAFAFCFASLRFRDAPMHLINGTVVNIIWITLPIVISFVIFRGLFGKYPFDPGASLWNIIDQLVLRRLQYFLGGAFLTLVSSLAIFLGAIAQAALDPDSVTESSSDVVSGHHSAF